MTPYQAHELEARIENINNSSSADSHDEYNFGSERDQINLIRDLIGYLTADEGFWRTGYAPTSISGIRSVLNGMLGRLVPALKNDRLPSEERYRLQALMVTVNAMIQETYGCPVRMATLLRLSNQLTNF